jgi:vacuolar-type H+-ATPase subunit E/Vma4
MNERALKSLISLDHRRADLEALLEANKKERTELESGLLKEFSEAGVQSVKMNGNTVYLRRDIYAKVKDGLQGKLIRVFRAIGMKDLVKTTILSQTLSALVREADKGETVLHASIANCVDVAEKYSLRVVKG